MRRDQNKQLEFDMLGKRNPVNCPKTVLQLNKVKGNLETASGFRTLTYLTEKSTT